MNEILETKKEILLIGIGRVGMRTLLDMESRKNEEVQCLAVDTEWEILKESGIWKRVLLGKNTTYGYRALSIEESFMATIEEEEELSRILKNYRKVFVAFEISSKNLTTIGILHVLRKIAKAEKIKIIALPFQLEGENREMAEIIKEHMDEVILLYDCPMDESKGVLKIDGLIQKANDMVENSL